LADLYVLQGQLEEAFPLYRKLIALYGSTSQVHFNLGVLAGRLGWFKEAIAEFSRAIELDPYSVETRMGIGIVYELMQRFDAAAAHYEAALEFDSENLQVYRYAARAYIGGDHIGNAINVYERLLEVEPNDYEAILNLVRLWVGREQFDQAEAFLKTKLESMQDAPQLYIALGTVYRESGNTEEALGAFERAASLNPNSVQTHFYLATQLDLAGHDEAAKMHLRRVIELDPTHADALNYLGYLDIEAGVNLKQPKSSSSRRC